MVAGCPRGSYSGGVACGSVSAQGWRGRFWDDEQRAELLALVMKGPPLRRTRMVRWRCVDLGDEVGRRFSVQGSASLSVDLG